MMMKKKSVAQKRMNHNRGSFSASVAPRTWFSLKMFCKKKNRPAPSAPNRITINDTLVPS